MLISSSYLETSAYGGLAVIVILKVGRVVFFVCVFEGRIGYFNGRIELICTCGLSRSFLAR